MKVEDKRPVYPTAMVGTNIEGRVNLEAVIGVDGTVRTMRTVDATNTDFELSAMEAVRQWRFTPTLLTCVPTEVTMKVLVMFTPEAAAPPPPPPPPPAPATAPLR
jgi:TonB family protein